MNKAVNMSVRRWKFIGVLLDGKKIELTGLPFISANEDAIRQESIRRAIEYENTAQGNWVMNVIMEAV